MSTQEIRQQIARKTQALQRARSLEGAAFHGQMNWREKASCAKQVKSLPLEIQRLQLQLIGEERVEAAIREKERSLELERLAELAEIEKKKKLIELEIEEKAKESEQSLLFGIDIDK